MTREGERAGPWPAYLFKQDRAGRLDYLCEFDHEDLERAKESVLWHGDWERQTQQVMNVMNYYGLLRDGLRVLDVGCGVGRVASALLERYAVTVVGVDRSPHMRRHFSESLSFQISSRAATVVGSLDDLPNTVFDLAILVEVAQHVPEHLLGPLLGEVRGRLAPGGKVFVYGNEHLDVNERGRAGVTTVESVVRRELYVLRSDAWVFEPQKRWSLLAEAP